jgi:hypothetical protein
MNIDNLLVQITRRKKAEINKSFRTTSKCKISWHGVLASPLPKNKVLANVKRQNLNSHEREDVVEMDHAHTNDYSK